MRSLTTLSRRGTAIGVALGVCALAAPTAVAAGSAPTPPPTPPATSWTARVLPSTAPLSVPSFLLDEGVVVGTDANTEIWGQGQPWTWSPATGRRPLSLGGADWGRVAAAPGPRGIVGTVYQADPDTGVNRTTAVRWVGGRPVPLMPDATANTNAETANRLGDAVVAHGSWDTSGTTSLIVSGQAPTPLPLITGRQVAGSMNTARQIVIGSLGPGTIGPVSYGVLQDGELAQLDIAGIRDFPACVGDITESGYVAGSQFVRGGDQVRRQTILWRAGVRTVLPDDGLSASIPCGRHPVNEAGHVVGTLSPAAPAPGQPLPTTPPRAVVWRDGGYVVLATDTAQETVRPVAINDRGAVLTLVTPTGGSPRPAVYADGTRQLLPVPAGLTNVSAIDINERNQVVGRGTRTAADGTTQTVTLFWTPPAS